MHARFFRQNFSVNQLRLFAQIYLHFHRVREQIRACFARMPFNKRQPSAIADFNAQLGRRFRCLGLSAVYKQQFNRNSHKARMILHFKRIFSLALFAENYGRSSDIRTFLYQRAVNKHHARAIGVFFVFNVRLFLLSRNEPHVSKTL